MNSLPFRMKTSSTAFSSGSPWINCLWEQVKWSWLSNSFFILLVSLEDIEVAESYQVNKLLYNTISQAASQTENLLENSEETSAEERKRSKEINKTRRELERLLKIIASWYFHRTDFLLIAVQFNYVLFLNTFLVEKNLKAGLVFGFQFPKFKFLDIKSQFHVQINSIYIPVNFNTIWIKTLRLLSLISV